MNIMHRVAGRARHVRVPRVADKTALICTAVSIAASFGWWVLLAWIGLHVPFLHLLLGAAAFSVACLLVALVQSYLAGEL